MNADLPCGIFNTQYEKDIAIVRTKAQPRKMYGTVKRFGELGPEAPVCTDPAGHDDPLGVHRVRRLQCTADERIHHGFLE